MATYTRYYEDENRRRNHDAQKEHGYSFTLEQVRDVLELVKNRQWPDGTYSDAECNLWSLVREVNDEKW